ncbi:MAG: glutathione S-transferase N-terminal domain-containing protein [Hyphomicrobiales bacterium]|nr:glutathione S-transferase N-terminal domain-containing protein [Hyphomicrobiales bacterium]MDE2016771.1 glutathione S-transferase N-terminal domain-containing protein [Hyphomicrobiales bacterium]
MQLHFSPGACSLGIHVMLEDIGAPYELARVDFAKRQNFGPEFLALNPKSRVPTLVRDDGSVLTEYPAIALWLGLSRPRAHLLPEDVEGRVRAMEAVEYLVSTVHMLGFTRIFRSERFAARPEDHDWAKERGREVVRQGFEVIAGTLGDKDWIAGDYSVADPTLFYCAFWAHKRLNMDCPPAITAHYRRMLARPAVTRALAGEGLEA